MYMKRKTFSSGFTLIELLIALAVIGVLATLVFVGLDPADKINAANDSKVQTDINAIAKSMEAYAVNNSNTYPMATPPSDVQLTLAAAGELKVTLAPPANYDCAPQGGAQNAYWFPGTGTAGEVVCAMRSKKYTGAGNVWWKWCASNGKIGPMPTGGAAAGVCP